jgi:hypothetical protein
VADDEFLEERPSRAGSQTDRHDPERERTRIHAGESMSDRSPKSKQRDHTQKKIAKAKTATDAKNKQDQQGLFKSPRTKATK